MREGIGDRTTILILCHGVARCHLARRRRAERGDLLGQAEEADPVAGAQVRLGRRVQEDLGGIRPLDGEDVRDSSFDRSTPRFLEVDSEENLLALFEENNWTDFLPIVLPTEERVEAML